MRNLDEKEEIILFVRGIALIILILSIMLEIFFNIKEALILISLYLAIVILIRETFILIKDGIKTNFRKKEERRIFFRKIENWINKIILLGMVIAIFYITDPNSPYFNDIDDHPF